jgi:hypothetical protein
LQWDIFGKIGRREMSRQCTKLLKLDTKHTKADPSSKNEGKEVPYLHVPK